LELVLSERVKLWWSWLEELHHSFLVCFSYNEDKDHTDGHNEKEEDKEANYVNYSILRDAVVNVGSLMVF
jgi:hypothetical protein